MKQLRLVKLSINISKIQITVKFPCSLKVQIRYEQQPPIATNIYPLKEGKCLINEILQLEIEAIYSTLPKTYRETVIILAVTIVSSNSNIPAGVNSFNPFTTQQQSQTQAIEILQKCSDRQAKIYYSYSWKDIKKIMDLQNQNVKLPKPLSINKKKLLSSSSFSREQREETIKSVSKEKDLNFSEMAESRVKTYTNLPPRYTGQVVQVTRQKMRLKSNYNNSNESSQRREKPLRGEKSLQGDIDDLNQQIQKYKQRIRSYQRRQRQFTMTIKELKQNMERKISKIIQSQSLKSQTELVLNQKQKQIKDYRTENKKYQEKIDHLKIINNTLEKKLQIKEKTYQTQIKLYLDKISTLEKDITKKAFQFNSLLQKMESNEKNNQLNLKEKEKKFFQEKNLLMKKSENLSQEIDKLRQIVEDKDIKYNNLVSTHKSVVAQEQKLKDELSKLESHFEILKSDFSNEKNQRISLQKEIQSLSSVETDKNSLKKKYNEAFQQLVKVNEKFDRLHSSYDQLTSKFNETDEKFKQSTKTNKHLTIQVASLTTQIESLKKQNHALNSEFNSLSAKHQMLSQKLNDIKSKLGTEKQQSEDLQTHYQYKVNYLLKTKQYVQSQVEDWKEKYQKQQIMLREIQIKNKSLNDQLLSRHEEYLKLDQIHKKSQQKIYEFTNIIEQLKIDLASQQKKQKLLAESLKSKGNDTYELQKKINEYQQEIYLLKEKIQSQAKEWNDKQDLFERNIHEKDKIISQCQNQIAELKNQLHSISQKLQKTTSELSYKKKELVSLGDSVNQHVQARSEKDNKIEKLSKELESLNAKANLLEQQLDKTRIKEAELEKNSKSFSERWAEYRTATTQALQQLLDQISLEQTSVKTDLLKFPDSKLEAMQINALKTRNVINSRHKELVLSLQQQIQQYKREMQNLKNLTEQKQKQFQQEIKGFKQKQFNLHEQWMDEKQQLNKQLSFLIEKKQFLQTQNQKYKSSIHNLEEINTEVNEEKKLLELIIDEREEEMSLLNEQILQFKSQEIKHKNIKESSLKDFKEQTLIQIDKLKHSLNQTSDKILQQQRQKRQKQNQLEKMLKNCEQITLQLTKQTFKRSQIEIKLKESQKQKQQLKMLIHSKDKSIEKLQNDIESKIQNIQSVTEKLVLLENQHKKIYQSLTETEVMKEKLQKILQIENQNSNTLKCQLRDLTNNLSLSSQETTKKIKEQKDQIVKLESQIQLKSYVIIQLENSRTEHENQIKDLSKQLNTKKQILIEAAKHIEELKNQILKIQASERNAILEVQNLQIQKTNHLDKIFEMSYQIEELFPKAEELTIQLQNIAEYNKKINSLEEQLHKMSLQLLATQNQVKNVTSKMSNKEEQFRTKIISLQNEIAQKQTQLKDSQAKFAYDLEREKTILMKQLEQQDKSLRDHQHQNKFRIDQLESQIQSLNRDCHDLSNALASRQEEITAFQQQNQEYEKKISDLNGELKACLEAWDKQKAAYLPSRKQMTDLHSEMTKFQDYSTEFDSKAKQLIQISRKKGSEDSKFGVTQLLRDLSTILSKSKLKILKKVESQQEKESIMSEYKQIQDKIDTAMRSQSSIYKRE